VCMWKTDFVKQLVSQNANTSLLTAGRDSASALHLAVRQGNRDCVRVLVRGRADLEERWGPMQETLLHLAVRHCTVLMVRLLCNLGANKMAEDSKGRTPLLLAVLEGKAESAGWLFQSEEPNWRLEEGWIILHWAARTGQAECVRVLVAGGADAEARDALGNTALHHAVRKGHLGCVQALGRQLMTPGADKGAKDCRGQTPVHVAAGCGQLKCLAELLAGGGVMTLDYDRATPLHLAAAGGSADCVQELLSWGANPQEVDCQGRTPLQYAEQAGQASCVALLCGTAAVGVVDLVDYLW